MKHRGFDGKQGERTNFAFCPTCHSLWIGVMGSRFLCQHMWESGRRTERKLKPRIAQRVRDGEWRW